MFPLKHVHRIPAKRPHPSNPLARRGGSLGVSPLLTASRFARCDGIIDATQNFLRKISRRDGNLQSVTSQAPKGLASRVSPSWWPRWRPS